VTVVPSSVATPARAAEPGTAAPRVLFVGTLDYPPNEAAVRTLVDLLPRVRAQVAGDLLVVGRRAPNWLRQAAAELTWLELREDAPEVETSYREARCAVVPIRAGGGTKLKVYEALSYGVPVVATPEAVLGIPVGAEDVTLADDDDALVARTVELLADPALAAERGRAARNAFVAGLAWDAGPARALGDALRSSAAS
jgi:glycosyltransferase involved in cell wall biosynthesis